MAGSWKSRRAARERFEGIARDLMNLEVNTIIKDQMMTARKQPPPAHALLDIANLFERKMTQASPKGFGLDGYTAFFKETSAEEGTEGAWGGTRVKQLKRPRTDPQTFHNLHVTARKALEESTALSPAAEVILTRIRRSSAELAVMLELVKSLPEDKRGWAYDKSRSQINKEALCATGPDLAISKEDRIKVRKIWEVGVEEVVMQTVVQLDGDVVTRIQRQYAAADRAHLWRAHMDGTRVAMESWQFLVEAVGRFVAGAARLFLPG